MALSLHLVRRSLFAAVLICLCAVSKAAAQSPSATLTGTVVDSTGAVLPAADLVLVHTATAAVRRSSSGNDGGFTFPVLPPGRYVLRASSARFAPTEMSGITLSVGDRLSVRVVMDVASLGETANVVADVARVSTSASVGTVVGRQFVENMPLNGRSLHALLELTPGVVLTGGNSSGFSVNGQRSNANYFSIDGVGANTGLSRNAVVPGDGGAGALPGYTALGTTAGMVGVDSLQEFRIETSSYAPEFGRTPGGQVSLVTRSGANAFHGSASEYFRHDGLDATDWFINYRNQRQPPLRQHDFGGVLGGPVLRDRTFFFGSYEGLRLQQPAARNVTVPSDELRRQSPALLQPYMNAFPLPNGRDLGGGGAELNAVYSDPSRVHTTSMRLDHNAGPKVRVFARGSISNSHTSQRFLAFLNTGNLDNSSFTMGATWTLSPRIIHDLRVNYTTSQSPVVAQPDDFGGATPPPLSVFAGGRGPDNTRFTFSTPVGSWSWGAGLRYDQRQINIIDSLVIATPSHEWKFGLDFRRLTPGIQGRGLASQQIIVRTVEDLLSGRVSYLANLQREGDGRAIFDNLSLYAQDAWKPFRRLTLTYGGRWEFVPPPHASDGEVPVTLEGLDDPYSGRVHLAPRGTPLWKARYTNIAPRIGASFMLSERPGKQLVVRGGFGMFYDLGLGQSANAFAMYPFVASKSVPSTSIPLSPDVLSLPDFDTSRPVQLNVTDPVIRLPFTYQWNVAAEQSLGAHQTLTVTYVGSEGRRLLKTDSYQIPLLEWAGATGTFVGVTRNTGFSDYRSLQVQLQQRLDHGLQTMIAYTLGRSRDSVSQDRSGVPLERIPAEFDYGYSDYDVRHTFNAAVTWQIPSIRSSWHRHILSNWGVDALLRTRSGFPVAVTTTIPFPPDSETVRPNLVPGQPFWLDDGSVPGGRRINRAAFSIPATGTQGNLPRGVVRGFNVAQIDLALRREIPLFSRGRLQFRFEMFNLFNTPHFANPTGQLAAQQFGIASSTLAQNLGGLNAVYQMGGPRSSQIGIKYLF